MEKIVAVLTAQQSELGGMLAGLDDATWWRPSRCVGWTIADVVLHLAQTNELAIASAQGGFAQAVEEFARAGGQAATSIDAAAELRVALERDETAAVLANRWRTSAERLEQVLLACDPHRRVPWVAGELSARTLATTRLAETWIHTGDVASALDVECTADDRLWHIARLAWRTLPYAFAQAGRELAGPVRFELIGPLGEDWRFSPDSPALSTVHGSALELCMVAARRMDPADTDLRGDGPDAATVLDLVRTYA